MLIRLLSPRLAATFALVAVGAAALAADPAWVVAAGLDVWNTPALQKQIEDGTEHQKELTAEGEVVMQRIEAKEAVVRRLTAGEITLAEASAQFLELNRSRADHLTVLRRAYPGLSDEEQAARNVIDFVALRLEGLPPARQAEVVFRLQTEFARFGFATATAE